MAALTPLGLFLSVCKTFQAQNEGTDLIPHPTQPREEMQLTANNANA